MIMVNDQQYAIIISNNTINVKNQASVRLYLGGLPMSNSLVTALYPTLSNLNTFRGCIRNVRSNGFYLDMNNPLTSQNSNSGACDCSVTNSCTASSSVATGVIVPWYVWLIIALVLLLMATVLTLILLTCLRDRQQKKAFADTYLDDTENDPNNHE